MIVQEYVGNPLLIGGLKFDLRVYVLVTCIQPLRIFMYGDGIARFATESTPAPNQPSSAPTRLTSATTSPTSPTMQ